MFEVKTVKDFIEKEKCACNQIAVYWYMPGYVGKKEEQNYFCEDCVPRGCDCNSNYIEEDYENNPTGIENVDWKWVVRPADDYNHEVKHGEMWVHIDEKGREFPCCEFMYDKDGFNKL